MRIKNALASICVLVIQVGQSHFTLDVGTHLKDSMNTTTFAIPVDCGFYNQVKVGDNLLAKDFRWGSFFMKQSIGSWKVTVKEKVQTQEVKAKTGAEKPQGELSPFQAWHEEKKREREARIAEAKGEKQ